MSANVTVNGLYGENARCEKHSEYSECTFTTALTDSVKIICGLIRYNIALRFYSSSSYDKNDKIDSIWMRTAMSIVPNDLSF